MSRDIDIEDLIERCVSAGVEASRTDGAAKAFRGEARHSTQEDAERQAALDAKAAALIDIFVGSQMALYAADPSGFRAHLVEVHNRMSERRK